MCGWARHCSARVDEAVSDKLARLDGFFSQWRALLEERALVLFKAGLLPGEGMNPAAKADAFSAQLGCQPIGFNWEMLDPGDDLGAPRSARATMAQALSKDIGDRKTPWLSDQSAQACAADFIAPFASLELSVVTNQLGGLWYPITGASDEWSFAAMDDEAIALLVLVPRG